MKCFTQSRPHWICILKEDKMFKFKTPSQKTLEIMSDVAKGSISENFENIFVLFKDTICQFEPPLRSKP